MDELLITKTDIIKAESEKKKAREIALNLSYSTRKAGRFDPLFPIPP